MIDLWPEFGNRYFRLAYTPPGDPETCPGGGQCHGPLAWCSFCGPVHDVCDVTEWPDRCDCHERYPEPVLPILGPFRQLSLPFPV